MKNVLIVVITGLMVISVALHEGEELPKSGFYPKAKRSTHDHFKERLMKRLQTPPPPPPLSPPPLSPPRSPRRSQPECQGKQCNYGVVDVNTCQCTCPAGEFCEQGNLVAFDDALSSLMWDLPGGRTQYDFPDDTGCGGTITGTGGYQYGTLASPNWPGPSPQRFSCTWTLLSFQTLFFVTQSYSSMDMDSSPMMLTVRYGDDWNETLPLGGYKVNGRHFVDVKRRPVTMTLVGYQLRSPITIFWWSTPRARFAKFYTPIFPRRVSSFYFRDTFNFSEHDDDTTGYIFIVKTKFTTYEAEINITGISSSSNTSYCGSITTFVYSHTSANLTPGHVFCDLSSNVSRIHFLGEDHPLSVPIGVKISMPKDITSVVGHIRIISETGLPVYQYNGCPSDTAAPRPGGERTYGPPGPGDNYPKLQCAGWVNIPSKDITDYLIQVQPQTDIPLTANCMAAYLKIGGYRLCGKHDSDYYVNLPFGNYLLEKTGAFYTDLLLNSDEGFGVTASLSEQGHWAVFAITPNIGECYRSISSETRPFFSLDMEDLYTVHAVGVAIDPSLHEYEVALLIVAVSLRHWAEDPTCWYGQTDKYGPAYRCYRPLSGRFVVVMKESELLTICKMSVLINIAAPVVGWRNSAYGRAISLEGMSGFPGNLSLLADGNAWSCVDLGPCLPRGTRLKVILYHSNVTVRAVQLHFGHSDRGKAIAFRVWGAEPCATYSGFSPHSPDSPILKPCDQAVHTRVLYFSDLVNITSLCEVLIYTDMRDEFPDVYLHNKALHSQAWVPSYGVHLPSLVDGSSDTCAIVDSWVEVVMDNFYFVHGLELKLGVQTTTASLTTWVLGNKGYRYFDRFGYVCRDGLLTVYNNSYWGVPYWPCDYPKEGRYVRITLHSNRYTLTLCEFRVFVLTVVPHTGLPGFFNVAMHKHARQYPAISIPKHHLLTKHLLPHASARVLVDGFRGSNDTLTTACVSLDSLGLSDIFPWWEVDLANLYHVSHVYLYLCPNWQPEPEDTIVVGIKTEKTEISHECASLVHWVMTCERWGRYVRVQGQRKMCLCEVEVNATLPEPYGKYGVVPFYLDGLGKRRYELFNFAEEAVFPERSSFSALYNVTELKNFSSPIDCGEIIRSPYSNLSPTLYPYTGAESFICHWMVQTPIDGFIVVFYMSLEKKPRKCFHQALILSNSAGEQVTLCGLWNEVTLQSFQGSFLHVTLMVRGYLTKVKIHRNFRPIYLNFKVYPSCANSTVDLSKDDHGELTSPLFPERHPPFAYCSWLLVAGDQDVELRVRVHTLALYNGGPYCEKQSLSIYTERLGVATFCNAKPPPPEFSITVQANDAATVVFKSKGNEDGHGFALTYNATLKESVQAGNQPPDSQRSF